VKSENFSKTLAKEVFLVDFHGCSGTAVESMNLGTIGLWLYTQLDLGSRLTSGPHMDSQGCFAAKLDKDSRQRVAANITVAYFPAEKTKTLKLL